jgi:Cft2 family RNA processing exonuclease
MRSTNGEDYAFVERYPHLYIPVNQGSATSLHHISQEGGDKLAVHEIPLEIRGAKNRDEIRYIRRIRGAVPELAAIELTDNEILVSLYDSDLTRVSEIEKILADAALRHFKRSLTFEPVRDSISPSLPAEDLNKLLLLAEYTWRDVQSSKLPAKNRVTRQQSTRPQGRDTHSLIIDLTESRASLICGGDKSESGNCSSRNQKFSCQLSRELDSEYTWRELLRTRPKGHLESVDHIHAGALRLSLHLTLLTSGAPGAHESLFRDLSCKQNKIYVRTIPHDHSIRRELFANAGPNTDLHDTRLSRDGKTFISSSEASVANFLDLKGIKFYSGDARFSPLNPADLRARYIIEKIPSGVGIKSIQACRFSGEILIQSARPIASELIIQIARDLDTRVSKGTTHPVAKYHAIQVPLGIISRAPGLRMPLSTDSSENIRYLTVYGAAGDIGGSSLKLGQEILLDRGGWPNDPERNHEGWISDNEDLKAVVVTHSHHDHVGKIVNLVDHLSGRQSPTNLQVIAHEATALSMYPPLLDHSKKKGSDFKTPALNKVMEKLRLAPLNYPVRLSENTSLTLLPAGHHIGSTMTLFEHTERNNPSRRVLYTGDLRSGDDYGISRLYPSAEQVADLDALIIEGTNGVSAIKPREELEDEFIAEVIQTVKEGGTVVLPVLGAGRAQEILTLLRRNIQIFQELNCPIFVEGRSIFSFNEVFSYISDVYPELLTVHDSRDQGWRALSDDIFKTGIRLSYLNHRSCEGPKVVVVSGGMGFGPAEKCIWAVSENPQNKVIFSCFQSPDSLGAKLLERAADSTKHEKYSDFKAQAVSRRLSGHNSGAETIRYVTQAMKPQGTVVLVHGALSGLEQLREKIMEAREDLKVVVAQLNTGIPLW